MPKVIYDKTKGLYQAKGSGVALNDNVSINLDEAADDVAALEINRNVTIKTSQTFGVNEISGSVLILRGRQEPLFFHMGGNQFIASNAWYEAGDPYGRWIFASGSSAFQWGFRGGPGSFDLNYAADGTTDAVCTWSAGLSLTASNGSVAIGKSSTDSGTSAQLDVTGSNTPIALSVTGSVDIGGAAPDAYFIPPRLTGTQRDNLTGKAGMLIYNTSTNKINFHNGTTWKVLSVD